ncbi:hypothetical protein KCU73_g6667, partial [Aureobasidium melanogenum]
MKTAEELMPGGRWLSVPGNNYQSAFYALTVGMSTSPKRRHSLSWSGSASEARTHDFLIKLWVAETGVNPDNHFLWETFQPTMFPALISVVNSSRQLRNYDVYQEKNGTLKSLNDTPASVGAINIFLRQINDRWECFSYFAQDQSLAITPDISVASSISVAQTTPKSWGQLAAAAHRPRVSTQGPKSKSRDGQTSNTFSPIVQVDIKPVANFDTPTDARKPNSLLNIDPWKIASIEIMADCLRDFETSEGFTPSIKKLCCWIEVLDVSRQETIRPAVGRFCSHLVGASVEVNDLLDHVRDIGTDQEKEKVLAMLESLTKDKQEEQVMQKKEEIDEHGGDEDAEQKGDGDAEQKKSEAADKKEEEEYVEERKRQEAEAAAAAYAAQDRDDSCSDSD